MIDLATPIDTLPLFNYVQNNKKNTTNSFPFIFYDNLNYLRSLYNSGKLRSITYDNIQKTILCGSVYLGYDYYACPSCGQETVIPHSCHSRFCTKCGAKETKQRAAYVSSIALDCPHRHIVFTIPFELRDFFIKHRVLLNSLFLAARNTLACLFNDQKFRKNKTKQKHSLFPQKKPKNKYAYKNDRDKVLFGSVMTLHTFGRDLKWNPHIHCLVCEEGYDTYKNKTKSFSFMSYHKLRKTWMYQVLDILGPKLGKDFDDIKQDLYRICEDGFYVYAKKREKQDDSDVEQCVNYITRYTSRPPMAESRIVEYNPQNKTIKWFYHDHKDEQRKDMYQHIHTFLHNLILHCPEQNFKMTRYYGFYSNKNKDVLETIYTLYGNKKKKPIKNTKQRKKLLKKKLEQLHYRTHMIQSYQRDPILCSCGTTMEYSYSYNPLVGGLINDRQYREKCLTNTRRLDRRRTTSLLRRT